jgi:hypothetical protein
MKPNPLDFDQWPFADLLLRDLNSSPRTRANRRCCVEKTSVGKREPVGEVVEFLQGEH